MQKKRCANINLRDKHGRTALFYAIESGRTGIFRTLLKLGAAVNLCDKAGTPLLVFFFRRFNCDPGCWDFQFNRGRQKGQKAFSGIFRLLLEYGADINAADREGVTVLMLASREDLVRCLLSLGANPLATTAGGRTIAMCHCESLRIIRLLKECGVDIHARDKDGSDLLMLMHPDYWKVRYLIEKYGFDTKDRNLRGESLLRRACEQNTGSLRLFRYLLAHGANPSLKNPRGQTPYDYLNELSYDDDIDVFQEKIMDLLTYFEEKITARLLKAARKAELKGMKHALEYGGSCNWKTRKNQTVVTLIAKRFSNPDSGFTPAKFRQVLQLFFQYGACLDQTDDDQNNLFIHCDHPAPPASAAPGMPGTEKHPDGFSRKKGHPHTAGQSGGGGKTLPPGTQGEDFTGLRRNDPFPLGKKASIPILRPQTQKRVTPVSSTASGASGAIKRL